MALGEVLEHTTIEDTEKNITTVVLILDIFRYF